MHVFVQSKMNVFIYIFFIKAITTVMEKEYAHRVSAGFMKVNLGL